jgi:aldose sugar dehydrogenase
MSPRAHRIGGAHLVAVTPAFDGSIRLGWIAGTDHLECIVFNAKTEELRRESRLNELRQRIREVRRDPDGLLCVLTDEDDGALLRIEPVS